MSKKQKKNHHPLPPLSLHRRCVQILTVVSLHRTKAVCHDQYTMMSFVDSDFAILLVTKGGNGVTMIKSFSVSGCLSVVMQLKKWMYSVVGAVESEVCGGEEVMNQKSLILCLVSDFTVSDIRLCNVKNADHTHFSDALFGWHFYDWSKHQIRDTSTVCVKSDSVRCFSKGRHTIQLVTWIVKVQQHEIANVPLQIVTWT